MIERTCYKCALPGGTGSRELRPYGLGGRDVCAGCVFGDGDAPANPVLLAEAEKQLMRRLAVAEPLVLDPAEQVGPRPLTKSHRN